MGGDQTRVDHLEQWLSGEGLSTLDRLTARASDVLAVMDPTYVVRYVNRTAPGLSRESVVGQSAFSLIPPSDTETAREAFDRTLLTGSPSRFEITYQNEVGLTVFVVRVSPIIHEGRVIGAFTINTDATEDRREAMDRDRFFSLSLDMLVVVTPDGMLRRINPAFGEALGYALADVVNQPFMAFVHPDDVKSTESVYQSVLAGRPLDEFENRYRRKDGTYRYFSWRATADPVTGNVYAVARDVTDHRATEIQLRHAQKMEAVGQLAGGVAHDFNNLMQAVLANVEFGLSPETTRAEMDEHLHEIASAGQRAAELTKQLLVFSRRQRLDRVSIDLNSLLGGLMKLLSRLLPENIIIQLKAGKDLPAVSADQTQLEQVVTNLCVNARDSMESGGTLTLETGDVLISESDCEVYPWTKAGYFVCLSVSDTGIGMTPEVRERVFEPFFTTKADRSGTGLGLSTLYGIVQQHGGMVHVYSEPGLGTSFKVYLPAEELRADKLPPASAPGREPSPAPRGTETILVVEDEESVRRPVLQILKRAGYRTFSASNGREGIERLQEHLDAIDLVILDVVMPEMGGPEAWEHMVALRPDLVSIFMSGYADARYRQNLAADLDVLDKPFPSQTLLERVRMRLDGAS